MFIVHKHALTNLTRELRARFGDEGHQVGHGHAMEAAAAALGFADVNAATALLRQRPILIGIPAAVSKATKALMLDRIPDAMTGVGLQVGRLLLPLKDVGLYKSPKPLENAMALACSGLPLVHDLVAEAVDAGSPMAGVGWEPGTRYQPDVALDVEGMAARLHTRLAARRAIPEQMEGRVVQAVWAAAFRKAVTGTEAEFEAQTWVPQGLIPALLDIALHNALGNVHSPAWRWSCVDLGIADLYDYTTLRSDAGNPITPDIMGGVDATIMIEGSNDPVTFDAYPYLRDADQEAIEALIAGGWRQDQIVGSVAAYLRGMDGYEAIDAVLGEAEETGEICEVWIDPVSAKGWLELHRPRLAARLGLAERAVAPMA